MGAIDIRDFEQDEWIESREAELREGAFAPWSEDCAADGLIEGPQFNLTDDEFDRFRKAGAAGDAVTVGAIVIKMVEAYAADRAQSQAKDDWAAFKAGLCLTCHRRHGACGCDEPLGLSS